MPVAARSVAKLLPAAPSDPPRPIDAMSCLAPHPASFLPNTSSQAYYTDAAIARALNSSMPDHYSPGTASTSSPSSSSSLLADLP
jgi:hypothetical protein